MGNIRFEKKEIVKDAKTLHPYFQGFGEDKTLLMGAELEMMFMTRSADGFRLPSDYENFRLTKSITTVDTDKESSRTIHWSEEPGAHMGETISSPYEHSELHFINDQIAANRAAIARKALELEITQEELDEERNLVKAQKSDLVLPEGPLLKGQLLISPFSVVPFATPRECMANIISPRGQGRHYSDRPRRLMESFKLVMSPVASAYPVTNVCVHTTHGVRDRRQGFEMSRLQAGLMSYFYVITENRPPYQKGSEKPTLINTAIEYRRALNIKTKFNKAQRGMFPEFLFKAKNENQFFDMLIKTVLNTPMISYFDHEGRFTPIAPGEVITPANMKDKGPECVSQFSQAMSQFWWGFKYKMPAGEAPSGLFHELRDFDCSPETVTNVTLIMGMLSQDDDERAAMIKLLDKKYGIPLMSDPIKAKVVIDKNIAGAYHRGDLSYHSDSEGRHMNVPFGSKGHTMLDFHRDLLHMLERHYRGTAAEERLGDMRFKAQTGMTNTQLWYDCFDSAHAQNSAMLELTEDPRAYYALYNQSKSWAQLHDEGHLPFLKPKLG
jgi:hypothetical protein